MQPTDTTISCSKVFQMKIVRANFPQLNKVILWSQIYMKTHFLPLCPPCTILVMILVSNWLFYWVTSFTGLEEVEKECQELNIEFHLLPGEAKDMLPKFMEEHHIGGVITDFSPLRVPMQWREAVLEALPKNVPMCMVGEPSTGYRIGKTMYHRVCRSSKFLESL